MKMSAKTLQMRFFCSRELCRASTWCSAPIQICLFGVHNAIIARKSTCHRKGENAELSKRYELIAFDLDGTLGEHKTPISDRHLELLRNLKERYQLVIAGAGTCQRIYNQVREFPIDILGSYGMQQSTVSLGQDGEYHLQMLRNDSVPVNIADTEERVFELRRKTGYLDYTGGNVEYHSSGAITFPLLGTKAHIDDKLAFDPSRERRRAIYSLVVEAFPEYNVFIGGSSSFDIVPKPFDKFHALKRLLEERGIPLDSVLYVGDDFGEGGNDEPVLKGGIDIVNVHDYRKLNVYLSEALEEPALLDN